MSSKQLPSTRNRTERAIVTAASGIWARDRAATLPQIAEAEPSKGHPLEAMRRVIVALASTSDAIMFAFGDQSLIRDAVPTAEPQPPAPHDPVIELIRRGQSERVFDDQLSAEWIP